VTPVVVVLITGTHSRELDQLLKSATLANEFDQLGVGGFALVDNVLILLQEFFQGARLVT
jgi:hypothetical protein